MDQATYYYACFSVLAFEFSPEEKNDTDKKIKQKLKYHKLDKYDQNKVEYVRSLKNELLDEISKKGKSRFFTSSKSGYASLDDFNRQKMIDELINKYNKINQDELTGIINYAIYLYHLK